MSALGMCSWGTMCEDPAVGMSSMGVHCVSVEIEVVEIVKTEGGEVLVDFSRANVMHDNDFADVLQIIILSGALDE